jgi:hopanoid biosynthesis associated protein HpnK
LRRVIISADDFGLSEAVNEGIERAHREGVLSSASLMVGGAAAVDAVRRAKAMPGLRVGLHLVVIEGPAVLPPSEIPDLVDPRGQFPSDQLGLGVSYAFRRRVRRQLEAEIRAQFATFAATGLALDHADAHKHMHMHPVVGKLMLDIGREFGLRAVRVPYEPVGVMARCGVAPGIGARAMAMWSGVLRQQARRAGMEVNERVFGLTWSGGMTEQRLLKLIPHLPAGTSEIYFHPAARRDSLIDALMPDYDHEGELAALTSPDVRDALRREGIAPCGYADLR